jgi:hypothetical protein
VILSFALPVITLREAEKDDADRIEDAAWVDGWGGFVDSHLVVNDKRVYWVLTIGSTEDAVVPVFEYINPSKVEAEGVARRYFDVLLASALTQAAKKEWP